MSLQGNYRLASSLFSFFLLVCCANAVLAKKKPPAHPVNLNTATSAELQLVPGIGPSTADKILQMRKSNGAFKSVDDLLAIKGIGPKRMEKMRKYLTVGKAPPSKKSSTDAQSAKAQAKPPPGKAAATKPQAKTKAEADSSGKDDE
jgi:competence protein ComEA